MTAKKSLRDCVNYVCWADESSAEEEVWSDIVGFLRAKRAEFIHDCNESDHIECAKREAVVKFIDGLLGEDK